MRSILIVMDEQVGALTDLLTGQNSIGMSQIDQVLFLYARCCRLCIKSIGMLY